MTDDSYTKSISLLPEEKRCGCGEAEGFIPSETSLNKNKKSGQQPDLSHVLSYYIL